MKFFKDKEKNSKAPIIKKPDNEIHLGNNIERINKFAMSDEYQKLMKVINKR